MDQGAKCVDSALASGRVFELEGWKFVEGAAKSGTLHLLGLLSDGGVHSRCVGGSMYCGSGVGCRCHGGCGWVCGGGGTSCGVLRQDCI